MTRILSALCIAWLVLIVTPAAAFSDATGAAETAKVAARAPAQVAPPTRDSLVAFFEEQMKNDPQVKIFTKRADGDYDFQTGFFPYTGRLKLLNAAVTKYDDQYYENLYRGIVEIDLPDADEAFFKKYARSYAAWTTDLNYYYNMKKGAWFAGAAWNDNLADFDKYAADNSPAKTGCTAPGFFAQYGKNLLPVGVFALVVFVLLLVAKRQNKRVWDNQAKALDEQQRGLKMAEESLVHQREHTKLLQEILAALKK